MQATLPGTPDVLTRADVLTEDELDSLPVGMIQLDRDGTVLRFNQTESSLARVDKRDALGYAGATQGDIHVAHLECSRRQAA